MKVFPAYECIIYINDPKVYVISFLTASVKIFVLNSPQERFPVNAKCENSRIYFLRCIIYFIYPILFFVLYYNFLFNS